MDQWFAKGDSAMKWLLFIAATIVVLILVVVLIGLVLPKAHRATRMARFSQPPDVVFAMISGAQDWRGVRREELAPPGGPRKWRDNSPQGTMTFEEKASDPPRLFSSRIADKNLPYSGTWTWEIAATADGCTCRITEEGEVYNPVFRFVSRFVLGHTKSIDGYLKAMGRKFNEPVKIEDES
jgi:hypothetical protein